MERQTGGGRRVTAATPLAAADGAWKTPRRSRLKPVKRDRFRPVPFADIEPATTPAYTIKDVLPAEGLVVVWGPPKWVVSPSVV